MTAAIVIVGGLTIVAGTLLPWMTLFAGLHVLRGIVGLYGRLIAAGGAVGAALGVSLALRDSQLVKIALSTLGVVICAFAAILLHNLVTIVGEHRTDPMMLASPGVGLYVCLLGATFLCVPLYLTISSFLRVILAGGPRA